MFGLLLLLQLQLWFGTHGIFKLSSLRSNIEQTRDQNDAQSRQNEQLHSEVVELKEGKEALEERARSQLGFIKEGEVFYRILPAKETDSN